MIFPFIRRLTFLTLKETIGQMVYTPIWWYSVGLLRMIHLLFAQLKKHERTVGLGIWVKSMAKPMYGQRDITSRLISFFVRLVVLFGRLILSICWVVVFVLLTMFYIMLPIVIVYGLYVSWPQ